MFYDGWNLNLFFVKNIYVCLWVGWVFGERETFVQHLITSVF